MFAWRYIQNVFPNFVDVTQQNRLNRLISVCGILKPRIWSIWAWSKIYENRCRSFRESQDRNFCKLAELYCLATLRMQFCWHNALNRFNMVWFDLIFMQRNLLLTACRSYRKDFFFIFFVWFFLFISHFFFSSIF